MKATEADFEMLSRNDVFSEEEYGQALKQWVTFLENAISDGTLLDFARVVLTTDGGMKFVCNFAVSFLDDDVSFDEIFEVLGGNGTTEDMLKCIRRYTLDSPNYLSWFWGSDYFNADEITDANDVAKVLGCIWGMEGEVDLEGSLETETALFERIENGKIAVTDEELLIVFPPRPMDVEDDPGMMRWISETQNNTGDIPMPKTVERLLALHAKL